MPGFEPLGRLLILLGVSAVLVGLLLVFWEKVPFLGRLPGDILLQHENVQFFLPLGTCLVLSAVLTILLNFVIRLLGK